MKLSYRGAKYESSTTIATTEGKVIGRYRGQVIREQSASTK